MAFISIIIKDSATGREREVEMPDDAELRLLLPELAKALGLEAALKELLLLQNLTQSFDYNQSDTLKERGTQENDVCLLKYETSQG